MIFSEFRKLKTNSIFIKNYKMLSYKNILISIFIVLSPYTYSQQEIDKAQVFGIITNENKETIDFATIQIKGTTYGSSTNAKGFFNITIPPGNYSLIVSAFGYEKTEKKIKISPDEKYQLNMELPRKVTNLDEVVVTAKSPIQQIKESAFNASVVDAKALHNTTLDVASALDRISGVKVRSNGGLGSDFTFSLNGFSGKHIKFFMDGMPMDGFGAGFRLNNIPINLVDRIEVYKGVVPVSFGADALGGVVNIVTTKGKKDRIDVSFATGSFNTYKSNISAVKTLGNGLSFQLDAFQNYSKNDYNVWVQVADINTSELSEQKQKVKRFNDTYNSAAVIGKIGFVDKKFADRLFIGFTYGKGKQGVQHGTLMKKVFGERHKRSVTIMPSLEYLKRNLILEGLDVSLMANSNFGYTQHIDTASYIYNWRGERKATERKGESGGGPSMLKMKDNNGTTVANIQYKINSHHQININNVLSYFDRKIEDPLARTETENEKNAQEKRTSTKNITGVSYQYSPNRNLNFTVFGKHYLASHRYLSERKKTNSNGYGVAATYMLFDIQLKGSYERTYRLPDANELFGDGGLEWANFNLKPEKGNNFNLGLSYNRVFDKKHAVYLDGSFTYRYIYDYIKRNIYGEGSRAQVENHGKVLGIGFSFEGRYVYNNFLSIGGNYTIQNLRNNEKYKSGSFDELSTIYKERMPNVPYSYGNAEAGINFRNVLKRGNSLYVGYNMQYIHQFYYDWEIYGNKDSKSLIPNQLSHNASISYVMLNKTLNLALECNNLTDERLFDNFSLQKPGRNFMFKIRYTIN